MKKKITLFLCALLALVAVLCVCVTAQEAEPTVSICRHTLTLKDNIWIVYYVDAQNIPDGAECGVLIWNAPQQSYTIDSTTTCGEVTYKGIQPVGDVDYLRYEYKNVAARDMATDYYAVAYVKDSENVTYSALDKYSVLQYAFNQQTKYAGDYSQTKLLNLLGSMLDYGAASQTYYNHNTSKLANDTYYQITVEGGTLPDGTTSGLYKSGASVTLTAPETTADGKAFLYWANEVGAQISDVADYTFTVGNAGKTYVATYEEEVEEPQLPTLAYELNADDTCYITGIGTYTDKVVYIPEYIDGHKVVGIGDKAFADQSELTAIIIPDTVTSIGTRAFYGCTGLTEMTIPSSVTSIGTQIFYKASNLSTIYYNSTYSDENNQFLNLSHITKVVFGGKSVPGYILKGCTNIKTVEIKDSVTSIGSSAFHMCTSLTSITIPDRVTSIGYDAFYGCTSLASIDIPHSVTSIGYDAFYGCTSLASVNFEDGSKCTSIGAGAFSGCTSLTSVTIPDSVTSIGYEAFEDCESLTSIDIPDSVTSIGSNAFHNCTSLKAVYISDVEAWLNIDFKDDDSNPCYYGADIYLNKEKLTAVVIPDTVTSIGDFAFSGCTSLTSVTIPDSVTSIGDYAFSGCKSLTSVTIPDSVTSIGDFAFAGCTSLTSVTIPDSVTSIGYEAFWNCTSLTTVYYTGTEGDWENISIGGANTNLTGATRYYYSEKHECLSWRYVDGVPTLWTPAEVIDAAVEATCTTTGLTEGKHCSVCNTVLVEQTVIPVINCNYVSGACQYCGKMLPAEGKTLSTLEFTAANRTLYSTTEAVWEANGVKVTNAKGSYTNDLGDYVAPGRFYKSTETTIECTDMTKIVFNVNTGKPVEALLSSLTDTANYTVTNEDGLVVLVFHTLTDSLTITAAGQFRLNSIVVYH